MQSREKEREKEKEKEKEKERERERRVHLVQEAKGGRGAAAPQRVERAL